ncbi:MAG: hypothetical protein ACI94Y_002625 [Maribacter sp.]|jgi:hypothetical protein
MKYLNLILTISFSFILLISACKKDEPLPPCEGTMFGMPVENTGLDDSFCKPTCECLDFNSKTFSADEIIALKSWEINTPFAELTDNPYDDPVAENDDMVCAIIIENLADRIYRLGNYIDTETAEAANAIVTHHDACGLCSTLTDFAVYAENRDIGDGVRACGLSTFGQPIENLVECIEALGFTKPCAQIWAYNTMNTRENCLIPCITNPIYHNPDGTLSDCLQCDEDVSGPVFKVEAGRTRRNTGLASSICRFCEEVKPVKHDYPF